eukprot:CAMPEP_0114253096 /NCGR_PEP_ID=MMETSP0058-20121206/16204_1 /TAXON_ID=36894 /ORGANISM="Pyramimonas parkeae, CCMP726" /LENGTH=207 /DNA_ID=CAMNT_0001367107 /DNA_START=48 /DNA_END=668 /DNA_ORIENTATION=+
MMAFVRTLPVVASKVRYTTVRGLAATANEDFVTSVFKDQQSKFRQLLDAHSKIPLPMDGAEASLNKYIAALEELKAKMGIKSTAARINDAVVSTAEGAESVRELLARTAELRVKMCLDDTDGIHAALEAALDKVESSIGAPLMMSDKKGMDVWNKEVSAIEASAGLPSDADLENEVKVEEVTQMIKTVKEAAIADMEKAKQRDGLEW